MSIDLTALQHAVRQPALWETPREFYANGRGYRHSLQSCRLRKKAKSATKVIETPIEAARSGCPECFTQGIVGTLDEPSALAGLLSHTGSLEIFQAATQEETARLPQLQTAVAALRTIEANLNRLADHSGAGSAYGTAISEALTSCAAAITAGRARMQEQRGQVALPVAMALLRPASRIAEDIRPSRQESLVLGDPELGWGRYGEALFTGWAASKVEGISPVEAAYRLEEAARSVQLRELSQLAGVAMAPTAHRGGSTLFDAATAAWKEELALVLQRLFARWDQRLDELLADTPQCVIAIKGSHTLRGDLYAMVAESHTVATRHDKGAIAVRVTQTTATWMKTVYSSASQHWDRAVHPVDATAEAIETALELWDASDSAGAYFRFEDCVRAAEALHA